MGVTEAPSERHASLSASSGTWRKSAQASFAFSSAIAAVGGAVPTEAWHLERSDTTPAVAATGSATRAPAPSLSVAVRSVICRSVGWWPCARETRVAAHDSDKFAAQFAAHDSDKFTESHYGRWAAAA
eukprot:4892767-Prymnesium_polylepis.1